MRDLFPGHYRPTMQDLKVLWQDALFVFDTNVLLNLYSYPQGTRDVVLSVIGKVAQRSWLPYQVALEFHRNKFNKIKAANKSVYALKNKLSTTASELRGDFERIEFDKRNTGITNLTERLERLSSAYSSLSEALDAVCEALPQISLDDPIGERISELFDGRIGQPPLDQKILDELISDGDRRYATYVPPGYKDAKKNDTYVDRNLSYPSKFGDLILWRQTIAHVKEQSVKQVIFVTGDRKEDWWDEDEGKIRGPHPQLVYEFLAQSGATNFWMYTVDQFLKFAEDYLQANEVTPETIAQVKETAAYELGEREFRESEDFTADTDDAGRRAMKHHLRQMHSDLFIGRSEGLASITPAIAEAISSWLEELFSRDVRISAVFDFLVDEDGERHAFLVTRVAPHNVVEPAELLLRARRLRKATALQSTRISVILLFDESDLVWARGYWESNLEDLRYACRYFKVNSLVAAATDESSFVPFAEI